MARKNHEDSENNERGPYRFADLELDVGRHRVGRAAQVIELPKLSFDLLHALVESSPAALSTDDLMDRVWDGRVVSPATIAKRVELLREALGDDSHAPRYVGLVRGYGYRLIPPVSAGTQTATLARRRKHFAAAAAIVVAALALALYLWRETPPPDKSVAVLPFTSMSELAEDEIFADGLTEELSHVLARSGDLKVTGRTSSFYYKNHNEDLRKIGETLGVAHLLEGSVRRSGDRLRVTAQLIAVDDGFHLWSETYDREMADILAIQDDIARNVAARLRVALLDAGENVPRGTTTPDPEAYALYLKAKSLSTWRAFLTLPRAQELIEQAIEIDPDYAPAWTRLAAIHGRRMYARDPTYPHSGEQSVEIIRSAVEKARALDPNHSEVYANLGGVAWLYEQDAAKAAPLIERAVELNPTDFELAQFATDFATFLGRFDQALLLLERLVDRDPLCTMCRFQLAKTYSYTGRLDDAEEQFRTLQVLSDGELNWGIGVILLLKGQSAEALESFSQLPDTEIWGLHGRAMALHDLGQEEETALALRDMVENWGTSHALSIAQALAYTDRTDEAFKWLFDLVPDQTDLLLTAYPEPLFNKLHSDPRWLELLERINRAPHQTEQISFSLPEM